MDDYLCFNTDNWGSGINSSFGDGFGEANYPSYHTNCSDETCYSHDGDGYESWDTMLSYR